jgi:hypothetical protein
LGGEFLNLGGEPTMKNAMSQLELPLRDSFRFDSFLSLAIIFLRASLDYFERRNLESGEPATDSSTCI